MNDPNEVLYMTDLVVQHRGESLVACIADELERRAANATWTTTTDHYCPGDGWEPFAVSPVSGAYHWRKRV